METPLQGDTPAQRSIDAYVFDRFRVDVVSRLLTSHGDMLPLSAKAVDALIVLLQNRSRVVGKDELVALVWPDASVSEDSLTQIISAIRRALGDDFNQPRFVLTVPRRGYRFIAHAEEVPARETPVRSTAADQAPASRPLFSRATFLIAAGIAVAAAALLVVAFVRRSPPPAAAFTVLRRFLEEPPAGTSFASGGVPSPDGRHIAFIALDERTGQNQLWVRALDSGNPRVVAGAQAATQPFWSPDGQNIGFFADGKLRRVGLGGEPPQTLADVGLSPGGGSWNSDGTILFAAWKSGIFSIPSGGGAVSQATTLSAGDQESAHRSPQFLPDGRHFLYYVSSTNPEHSGTFVSSIGAADRRRLTKSRAVFALPDLLVYYRDEVLMAERVDLRNQQLTGIAKALATADAPIGSVAATADLLTFRTKTGPTRLVWYDRSGHPAGGIDAPRSLHNPVLTNDQTQLVAATVGEANVENVWVVDLERGAPTRVTDGKAPLVSPDGTRIAFTSDRLAGVADLYVRSTGGRTNDELLLRTGENKIINDWSRDGKYIVFVSTNPTTKKDIWLLPTGGDRKPVPFLRTPFNEIQAKVSPDGRWLAYASDESGQWEVYIQPFPVPGTKQAVSVGGGAEPQWRSDGREIFYLGADHRLMTVEVKADGAALQVSRPTALFQASVAGELNTYRSHYVSAGNGQRFLIDAVEPNAPITVLVGWAELLKP